MERTRLVLILMALCLALVFSVSSVEAQERQCKNGADDDGDELVDCLDPDCASKSFCSGGGGGACETPNAEVGWVLAGLVSEPVARLCVPTMIQEQGNDGSYSCGISDEPIMFNLGIGSVDSIHKQGNDEVCSYFEDGGTFIASRLYGMHWEGPCLEGDPCRILIHMWSPMTDANDNPIEHDPPGPSGPIALGFTRVIAFASVDEDVCNPFTLSGPLLIDEISIRVQRPGNSHKVMADCEWTGEEDMFLIETLVLPE